MRHQFTGSVWGGLAAVVLAISLTSCTARVDSPAAPSSARPNPPAPVAPEIEAAPPIIEGVDTNRFQMDYFSRLA